MKNNSFEIAKNISFRNSFLSNKWSVTCISLLGPPVIAAFIIPNVLLYLTLPTICILFTNKHLLIKLFLFFAVQIPTTNQTNITQPKVYANYCGGVSSYINWEGYLPGTQGIRTVVSTTNCSFSTTPRYYVSIQGKNFHTDFTGYNNVYSSTPNGFTIFMYSSQGFNVEQFLNYSQIEQWNISWVGVFQ